MNYKFYLQFKDQRLYEEVIALVLRYSLSGYMVDYHIYFNMELLLLSIS